MPDFIIFSTLGIIIGIVYQFSNVNRFLKYFWLIWIGAVLCVIMMWCFPPYWMKERVILRELKRIETNRKNIELQKKEPINNESEIKNNPEMRI